MRARTRRAAAAAIVIFFSCAGAAGAGTRAKTNQPPAEPRPAESDRFARSEDGRTKILVLPPEFKLFQLGASGVTTHEVPEWSQLAERNGSVALSAFGANSKRFMPVAMPEVTPEERALIEEHLALADNVSYAAFQNNAYGGKAWEHKKKDFDYTLGPKLAFLRERSGADLGVFTIGVETISTGGRVAMSILFAAAGVGIPMGQTFMIMGVVELETGRLLWVNQRWGGAGFRDQAEMFGYVDGLLCQYPYGTVMGDKPKPCGRKWALADDGTYQPTAGDHSGARGSASRKAK